MVRMVRQKDKRLVPDGTEELQSYNSYLLTSFCEKKINLLLSLATFTQVPVTIHRKQF